MISVFGSYVDSKEVQAVKECLESQWLGMGKKVDEFESMMKKHLGTKNFLMVDNGSNALYMAISLLDLPKRSKIVVPSFTWVSCAQAVVLAGHIPVFADVDISTMNITRETVDRCLSKNKAKAIMVVHYAGLPVEMEGIMDIGLPVIEDAAHAVCSKYNNVSCGTIGDIGIYSFDSMKNIATSDGGGITFKNDELMDRAKTMRYCGIGKSGFQAAMSAKKASRWWEYNIQEFFIRMIPNDVSASIGIEQLKKIDYLQDNRRSIWKAYTASFKDLEWLITPKEGESHSYFTYCIRVPDRDRLAKYLLDNGVYTTLRYHPLHMNPIYKKTNIKLHNCEVLNDTALSIPLHPRLTFSDVSKIINLISEFKC